MGSPEGTPRHTAELTGAANSHEPPVLVPPTQSNSLADTAPKGRCSCPPALTSVTKLTQRTTCKWPDDGSPLLGTPLGPSAGHDRIWPDRLWPEFVFSCFGHVWSNVFLQLVGCVPLFCGCCVWCFWACSTCLERVQHLLGVLNIFAPILSLDRPPPGPPSPRTAQNFALSSLSGTCFFISSLSWVSSRGILVVFLKRGGPEMCTFGLSGCHVKPWRPQSRRTESPNVHI